MFLFGILKFVPNHFTDRFFVITDGKEYVSLTNNGYFIGKENELIRTVLTEEVNMLYEVFMAATLPEYQKERISRAVNEMRERLSASGEGNEEA